jgi:2'-phosphotransferase
MRSDGFALVSDILQLERFKQSSEREIRAVVDADAKSRFALSEIDGRLFIRANQGHSMGDVVKSEELLTPITAADVDRFPLVLHGTYHKAFENIATEGLKPMARTHVHCSQGLPGADGVISGMRPDTQIVIVVDLAACVRDGLPCFVSANGVVMLPPVAPRYFSHVLRKNKKTKAFEPFDERFAAPHATLGVAAPKKPSTKEERVEAARLRQEVARASAATPSGGDDLYAEACDTPSTAVCKFFAASTCTFGARCRSAHDMDQVRAVEQAWLAERRTYASLARDGRRTHPQQRHLHEAKPVAPEFDLLAVLDLEGKEEIIELPVLVLRASDCEEVGRFHTFVCPTTCASPPPLAVPFTAALAKLDAFLAPLKRAHGARVGFVTCGDWDLKKQIPYQSRISKIEPPAWCNEWINVKHVFNRFCETRITGMPAMLTLSGIPLVGQHHLGMDDVSNIAKIVAWLRFRGAPIVLTAWRAAADAEVTFRWPELVERHGKPAKAQASGSVTGADDDDDNDDDN